MAERIQDQWARWLLQRRHGGDPQVQKAMLDELSHVRDTVLQNAQVAAGNTLLDVDVSADFLRGGVTVAGVIVDYDVTVADADEERAHDARP